MGFGKDGKGVMMRDSGNITLSTLASEAVIGQDALLALKEKFRILKGEFFFKIEGATYVDADGPLIIGLASGELSNAEIASNLNAIGPLGPADQGVRAAVERAVFPIAMIDNISAEAARSGVALPPISKNFRWTFMPDLAAAGVGSFKLFAYNHGSSAMTAGSVIRFLAKYYGVWV